MNENVRPLAGGDKLLEALVSMKVELAITMHPTSGASLGLCGNNRLAPGGSAYPRACGTTHRRMMNNMMVRHCRGE